MLVKLIEYVNSFCVIILSFAPFLGLIFTSLFSIKTIKYLSFIILILFLPYLLGFRYLINCFFEIILTFINSVSCYFLFITLKKIYQRIILASILSFLCFSGLFVAICFSNFMISIKKSTYKINREYCIEYRQIQPFSGRAEERLELNKYLIFPIITRKIDTYDLTHDTTNKCNIVFPNTKIIFDRCETITVK
jgi:hypothetical protein